jgi:plasmid stabilization system protein ParE
MGKPWRLHRAAERELDEAADRYDAEREGLGREFLREVQATVEQLARTPGMGAPAPEVPPDLTIRRFRVRRFPYWVVYLELHHEYRVLAVAHERRHSSYWRVRLEGG